MNYFDPFLSSEYKPNIKEELEIQSEPILVKKSDTQFISDFLSNQFKIQIKQVQELTQVEVGVIPQKISEFHEMEDESVGKSSSQGIKKNGSKSSPFHNFQKHLVITLRQNLTLNVLQEKIGVQNELALRIFENFKKSQKTSRLFLEHIFGLIEKPDRENQLKFLQNIRKGELKSLLENYEDETILQAQQILKHLAREQLEWLDIRQCIAHRKIEKKEEFIEYFNLFRTELQQGKQRKKTYKLLAKKFQQKKPSSYYSSGSESAI